MCFFFDFVAHAAGFVVGDGGHGDGFLKGCLFVGGFFIALFGVWLGDFDGVAV